MPVTLYYFPVMARGLAPALSLEVHGVEWEGKTLTMDTWPAMKESGKCPFGQLPVLETPEMVLGQSVAIVNYPAMVKEEAGGKTLRDRMMSAQLTMQAEDLYSLLAKYVNTLFAKDKAPKEEVEKMWNESFAKGVEYLEKLAEGKDAFTSTGITTGEVALFATLHQAQLVRPEVLDKTPSVKSFVQRMANLDGVKKVLEGKTGMGSLAQYFVA